MEYKYTIGDRVLLQGKKYIISDRYYPDGYGYKTDKPPAYCIYPPGKKKSYGHYCWAYEKDLQSQ